MARARAPRPVVFDMDGVLVDSEPLSEIAFGRYLDAVGRPELASLFPNTLGRRQVDFVEELAAELALTPDAVSTGLDSEFAQVLAAGELRALPFAVESVRRLGAGARRLGLASSSGRAFIELVLARLGIRDAFAAIAAGDEARHGKPHPELYLTAAERLEAAPETCIAIEDTPAGARSASAAGMTVIAVPNGLTEGLDLSAARAVVPSLAQATELVLRLDAEPRPVR